MNAASAAAPMSAGIDKEPPVHPGEILLEEFLKPLQISQYHMAKDIRVSPRRINEIVHGKRAISAETALRLAHYFGTSPRFWLHLQARYDLDVVADALGERIEQEVRPAPTLADAVQRAH